MIDNYIEDVAEGKKIKLAQRITKDGEEMTHIIIKEPNAGSLRGLNLVDVLSMKFDAATTLIPRLTVLNERDVLNLKPANLTPIMTGIASFFVDME